MQRKITRIIAVLSLIFALRAGVAWSEETEETITIEIAPFFSAVFNTYHGTISSLKLHEERFSQKEKPVPKGAPAEKFSGRYEMILPWDSVFFPYQFQFKLLEGKGLDKIKRTLKSDPTNPVKVGKFRELYEADPAFTPVRIGANEVVFVWPDPETDESPLYIEKRYIFSHSYTIDLVVTLYNLGESEIRSQFVFSIYNWESPFQKSGGIFSPPPDLLEGVCHSGGSINTAARIDILSSEKAFDGETLFAGVQTRYFLNAVVPKEISGVQCSIEGFNSGVVVTRLHQTQPILLLGTQETCLPDWFPAEKTGGKKCRELEGKFGLEGTYSLSQLKKAYSAMKKKAIGDEALAELDSSYRMLAGQKNLIYRFKIFSGPKDIDHLKEAGSSLEETIDFWALGFISKPMLYLLRFFYSIIPQWSVAIILLTLLVKLLTIYWSEKSLRQMKKLAQLKPKIDEIREKYKNDKMRLNQEMMNLYKMHKVNPLGGCLPMLLQMPIWIALYRTIYVSVDLYQAPLFLWLDDLSSPDPYYIMPVSMGALMFLQQKLQPVTMDPQQAKIMLYVMPALFTLFMLFLPAGLTFYILVNTVLGILHQWLSKKMSKDKPAAEGFTPTRSK